MVREHLSRGNTLGHIPYPEHATINRFIFARQSFWHIIILGATSLRSAVPLSSFSSHILRAAIGRPSKTSSNLKKFASLRQNRLPGENRTACLPGAKDDRGTSPVISREQLYPVQIQCSPSREVHIQPCRAHIHT